MDCAGYPVAQDRRLKGPFMSYPYCFALLTVFTATIAFAQPQRTWFTDQRIAAARENVERYEWAQSQRDRIIKNGDTIRYYIGPDYTAADTFVELTDEQLWLLQPTTEIPRPYDYNENRAICPVHGDKVKQYSVWCPWNIDPINHPYQIQCMMGKEWYPSNKYHEGDMTSGDFPDDGSGCVVDGERYHFLKEYAHMVYGSVVVPTLSSLSQAYMLTGDERYGRKGAILMARLATQYPNYGWPDGWELENRYDRTYLGPWDNVHPFYPGKKGGMITDQIWSTFMLEDETYAYDALRPMFDDPQVLAFVRTKGLDVADGDALRTYIENYVLRAGMIGLLNQHIRGNQGHHQAAAAAVALVLNDYSDQRPNSIDLIDYLYDGYGASRYIMVNSLTRDGGGHESPSYSTIKFDFIRVARLMQAIRAQQPDRFDAEQYPDPFEQPKARQLFDFYIDALILDQGLPAIGDTGGISAKITRWKRDDAKYSFVAMENIFAFLRYGDPRYARAATDFNTGAIAKGELWEAFPADEIQRALERPESRIERESRLLDGYGMAILESGADADKRSVMLNYSSLIGHRQMDQLMIQLHARGVNLLPDLGYPRTWDYRWQWDAHNMAANTVTVDEKLYDWFYFFRNGCRLFASADGVHVVNAYHNPYAETDRFERTVVMIDVDDERFYVVDHFQVSGGHQHDQSWHAMLVEPQSPDLAWVEQDGGTLAGPDVDEFGAYTDPWGREYPKGNLPSYITDVRRAPLSEPATWTWRSGLEEGDALAMHVVPLGGPAEVIMGKGRSPVWTDGNKLDYVFVRRQVENGGASRYVTVLDPYQGEPIIQSVRVISEQPLTLEITRDGGTDEVVIDVPDSPSRTTAYRPLGVAVRSAGRDVRIGSAGEGYASASIASTNHDAQRIALPYDADCAAAMQPGRHVRIYNDLDSSMFRIVKAERVGDTLQLTFDQTALVGMFPVDEVLDDGRMALGATSPYIRPGESSDGVTLDDAPNSFYHGVWLGEGDDARLVEGITHTTPPYLRLHDAPAAGTLRDAYQGQVISLWRYAAGDKVEVAKISR
jgi:hypothetical protein